MIIYLIIVVLAREIWFCSNRWVVISNRNLKVLPKIASAYINSMRKARGLGTKTISHFWFVDCGEYIVKEVEAASSVVSSRIHRKKKDQ
jgi:hypothetical protein